MVRFGSIPKTDVSGYAFAAPGFLAFLAPVVAGLRPGASVSAVHIGLKGGAAVP